MVQRHLHLAAGFHLLDAFHADAVVFAHLVVVVLVGEGQCQHTLLLQIGLVDAGEALGQDDLHVEEARLHGSMLTRRALTVVVLSHDDAAQAMLLIVAGSSRHLFILSVQLILHGVALVVERIDSAHEQVGRDVLKVTAIAQPRTSHRDVVGGAFALHLDEQRHVVVFLPIPGRERLQPLQTL